MRELQALFETPPRVRSFFQLDALLTTTQYGKSLDWKQESYTTHDVASVFRRYLTQMPVRYMARFLCHPHTPQEPVIPHGMYHAVREALGKAPSAPARPSFIHDAAKTPFNQEEVIATYKRLIRGMPRANQYLLLYVLDLLSVFARKADKNLMTATSAFPPSLTEDS
jgi:hypothetical protein